MVPIGVDAPNPFEPPVHPNKPFELGKDEMQGDRVLESLHGLLQGCATAKGSPSALYVCLQVKCSKREITLCRQNNKQQPQTPDLCKWKTNIHKANKLFL